MGSFEMAKLNHAILGHDNFVAFMKKGRKSDTFIYNVCADIICPQKGEDKTDHQWETTVFKNSPAMKCRICGFIWQPHMRRPKVTCDQILSNRNPRKRRK